MDDCDLFVLIKMRVGVKVGWRAMRSPTRVRNREMGVVGHPVHHFAKFAQFSSFLLDFDDAVIEKSDTGAVISTVLEPF
jgi:hypothetical protein